MVNRSAAADCADELLQSPDAPDAFSKTEYKEIQEHLEKTVASQQHFSEVVSAIGAARAKIAKGMPSKRKPISLPSRDEWIAADVMKHAPHLMLAGSCFTAKVFPGGVSPDHGDMLARMTHASGSF